MKVIVLLLVTFELCWTIRVPVTWNEGESEVIRNSESNEKFSVESFKPQDFTEGSFQPRGDDSAAKSKPQDSSEVPQNEKPIPVEYFEYTAKKPQFAVDVAAFHGVQSPENHYKAYPIRPHTGRVKPDLGKHHIFDSGSTLHKPFQDYIKSNDDVSQANPVSSSFEVFHPYEAETPALREIYKDPILSKIRNDLENSKNRLQQYEKDAGEPNISKDEYLESPQKTDGKLFPHRHRPAPFEIHRPHRRPVYYRPGPPVYKSREQYLNQKLRHPWNHNTAKVRPMHYRPIQNHIYQLRQNHALKYDDERNEYPQVQILENYSDPKDGYDIYERGKEKYVQLRNNVDESINNAVKENRPALYEKLEMQNNDSSSDDDEEDEEEFIPIKNYAQVRKTETFRHLPRAAALEEAATYDEIKNSPRLREAVKSTKAQTVYSEEGYEDAAYDHAGEHKHASENEGHGGFLKEKELSGGKYKTPSVSANYEDGTGSVYRDQLIHAEKWKDDNKDTKEEADGEDYAEDEHEYFLEADNYQTEPQNENDYRNKHENKDENAILSSSYTPSNVSEYENVQHELDKRETKFEVPQVDLNSTFIKEKDFLKTANLKVIPKKDSTRQKYPYYFKNLKTINRNSPLKYAENLKFIPKKSKGGTEFYDSRSKFECPEVDDVPDPIPEKLKGDGHPNDDNDSSEKPSSTKGDENFDTTKKQPRLKGLGDKIDCFKAKYFGENPLDSPFFKEDIISRPEPVFLSNIASYKLNSPFVLNQEEKKTAESKLHKNFEKIHETNASDLFDLMEKLRSDQNVLQSSLTKSNKELVSSLSAQNNLSSLNSSQLAVQSSVYDDVIENIKTSLLNVTPQNDTHDNSTSSISIQSVPNTNTTYTHFQSKEDITKSPLSRKKRATLFVYEPYKIIRDSQVQDDSKKTTIASNASPLIKQLQSSKVIDSVNKHSPIDTQHVKRNVNTRPSKDIGQKGREIKVKYGASKNDKSYEDSEIVDVSIDTRRGEPRYEIKHGNHKSRYTPVTNKKSMTVKDYESQIVDTQSSTNIKNKNSTIKPEKQRRSTEKPYFDISKYIPNLENTTTSYTVADTISTTLRPHESYDYDENNEDSDSEEDYEEYDADQMEEKDDIKIISTTTTSTTSKPTQRRKSRPQITTQEPLGFVEEPRLKLVTRFRDFKPPNHHEEKRNLNQREEDIIDRRKTTQKPIEVYDEDVAPKFREKKKKVTKSTLVTDTKRYGDAVEGDDKMMKDEVDALIGVKHDMDDYLPPYEKYEEQISKEKTSNEGKSNESKDSDYDDDAVDEDDEDEDEDEDDDEDDDFDYEDEDDNGDNDDERNKDGDVNIETGLKVTTPEPTKRTLVITTDAPVPTIASRSAKLQVKPIVTRKTIEIHKELPVNKSSPHLSQFKQDIKEIEITKEIRNPLRRKPNKNVEVLDLYKDDNLAKDINKLGVEIFKENLNIRQGPKHGGNYRSADISTTVATHELSKHSKDDAETSQSENKKHVKPDADTSKYLLDDSKSLNDRNIRSRGRNVKTTELSNTAIHGGHLKYGRSRNNNARSQKLIELEEDEDENDSSNDSIEDKSYNDSKRKPMHGGNYRSAQLRKEKVQLDTESTEPRPKDARRNAALVLSSFVQAAPVLTTNSGFILDPSKRKYYYVDA